MQLPLARRSGEQVKYARMARCVMLALAVFLSGLHPAWAQTRATSVQSQRQAGAGQIRTVRPADPATPRSRSGLRFEPRQETEPSTPRSMHPFGFAPWWFWDTVIPAPFRLSAVAMTPLTAGPLGGIQLDVQPWRAQVYADGAYAGEVEAFSGYYRHLSLVAGPHVITIVADGYEPLVLEVLVSPGQTLTYRGSLAYAPR